MGTGPARSDTISRPEPLGTSAAAITFDSFRLDLRAGRLIRGSQVIPLRPKTWALLHYLAERPGVLLSKNDLLDALWPSLAVTESVLSKSIGELRVALGDNFKTPRLIETVQRRGFRFIAPISAQVQSPAPGGQPLPPPSVPVADRSTFVGRTRELRRLGALLAQAQAGQRQLVPLNGGREIPWRLRTAYQRRDTRPFSPWPGGG